MIIWAIGVEQEARARGWADGQAWASSNPIHSAKAPFRLRHASGLICHEVMTVPRFGMLGKLPIVDGSPRLSRGLLNN